MKASLVLLALAGTLVASAAHAETTCESQVPAVLTADTTIRVDGLEVGVIRGDNPHIICTRLAPVHNAIATAQNRAMSAEAQLREANGRLASYESDIHSPLHWFKEQYWIAWSALLGLVTFCLGIGVICIRFWNKIFR